MNRHDARESGASPRVPRWLHDLYVGVVGRRDPQRVKHRDELAFWRAVRRREGTLGSDHFRFFFTDHFGLEAATFRDARILDIGCGPRGSLEWADMANERIGLDPLVESYRELGIDQHAMRYVGAPSEEIPFPDGHFDVVSSFNSLDHVDDLDRTVSEIVRVLRDGGHLLLLTEVGHEPTVTEPISFSWDVVDMFAPTLHVVREQRFDKDELGVYQSVLSGRPPRDPDAGVLSALLVKGAG